MYFPREKKNESRLVELVGVNNTCPINIYSLYEICVSLLFTTWPIRSNNHFDIFMYFLSSPLFFFLFYSH